MPTHDLIAQVRRRAANPSTRTDYAEQGYPELPGPLSVHDLASAEAVLGFPLHALHRRVITDVANGGFGPGDGLLGFPGGRLDHRGRSVLELRDCLGDLPEPVVPLVDWGCAIWTCVDENTGCVLTLADESLVTTQWTLHSWFSDWVGGKSIWAGMFEIRELTGINPFTREPFATTTIGRALGRPYFFR